MDTRGARENLTPADTDNAWWNSDICIRYTLKDGSTFARTYTFLCSASTAASASRSVCVILTTRTFG